MIRQICRRSHSIQDIINNYQPISPLEKVTSILTHSVGALVFPKNSEHLATFGELTSESQLQTIRSRMQADEVGAVILQEKPRIRSAFVDFQHLRTLPPHTLGYHYMQYMDSRGLHPDERPLVKHIEDMELAYIYQRYKEIHDFLHVILNKQISIADEVKVKWFEYYQLNLFSAGMASVFGPLQLSPSKIAEMFTEHAFTMIRKAETSKFCMNVYYEKHFEEDIGQFRNFFFNRESP